MVVLELSLQKREAVLDVGGRGSAGRDLVDVRDGEARRVVANYGGNNVAFYVNRTGDAQTKNLAPGEADVTGAGIVTGAFGVGPVKTVGKAGMVGGDGREMAGYEQAQINKEINRENDAA